MDLFQINLTPIREGLISAFDHLVLSRTVSVEMRDVLQYHLAQLSETPVGTFMRNELGSLTPAGFATLHSAELISPTRELCCSRYGKSKIFENNKS